MLQNLRQRKKRYGNSNTKESRDAKINTQFQKRVHGKVLENLAPKPSRCCLRTGMTIYRLPTPPSQFNQTSLLIIWGLTFGTSSSSNLSSLLSCLHSLQIKRCTRRDPEEEI
ncbi:unnamed protein product [Cuscuta europaea]|uniref:Uncharacterized protein n=1 Tax=Cuscuta europaea TaxID=41803 RepID=A0A9P0ZDI1_CUSEU|nr:unnamed protein product [Cuscuta europaea]